MTVTISNSALPALMSLTAILLAACGTAGKEPPVGSWQCAVSTAFMGEGSAEITFFENGRYEDSSEFVTEGVELSLTSAGTWRIEEQSLFLTIEEAGADVSLSDSASAKLEEQGIELEDIDRQVEETIADYAGSEDEYTISEMSQTALVMSGGMETYTCSR